MIWLILAIISLLISGLAGTLNVPCGGTRGMNCSSGEVCCQSYTIFSHVLLAKCSKSCYNLGCETGADCLSSDLYCHKRKVCKRLTELACLNTDTDCLRENKTTSYPYCCKGFCRKESCSYVSQETLGFIISILVILLLVVAMVAFCWRISLYYRRVRNLDNENDDDFGGPFINRYDFD